MNNENIFAEVNSLSGYIEEMERIKNPPEEDIPRERWKLSEKEYQEVYRAGALERIIRAKYNFIYRGERRDYPKRVAGAFRMESNNSHYPDFRKAVDDFYRQVGYRLSDTEKDNFVAFAQHHGLPTNLLDVTSSPLTALFMACYDEYSTLKCEHEHKEYCRLNKLQNSAYVYIFEDYIDVTDILNKYPNDTVVDLLIRKDEFVIKELYKLLLGYARRFSSTNKLSAYYKQLLQNIYNRYKLEETSNSNDPINMVAKCAMGILTGDNSEDFHNIARRAKDVLDVYGNNDSEAFAALREAISKIKGFEDLPHFESVRTGYFSTDDWEFAFEYIITLIFYLRCAADIKDSNEFMPYMIYKPKIAFERARLQQGFFIIQPFRADNRNNEILLLQEITHSKVIKINNPNLILQQLDYIGVNLGTMYGDFDNIAKHIKNKYNF